VRSDDDTESGGTASRSRLLIAAAGLALLLAGLSAQTGGAAASAPTAQLAQADDVAAGAVIFADNCATCHKAGGVGVVGTFPPLLANPAATDPEYVTETVRNGLSGPLDVLGVTYNETMDPFPELSDDEVAAVAAYVGTLADRDPSATPTPEPEVVEPGDIDEGRDLFEGANRFDNGGAACAACHTAGDVGNLGGWSLGPDLTGTHESFGGDAGLTGWLGNPRSATMRPIFRDQPMTPDEIADIVAFLGDAPNQSEPSDPGDGLILAGAAGFLILIGGMAIAWRGMRQTYAERLRSKR